MLPLVSLTTQVLLVALVAMAMALGAMIGALLVRARRPEQVGRVPERKNDGLSVSGRELAALRARIDELCDLHPDGAEAPEPVIARRLGALQERVNSGSRQIEALRDQLMDEIQRRDAEMDALRGQLLSALHMARAEPRPQRSAQEGTGGQEAREASLFSADYFHEFSEFDSVSSLEAEQTVEQPPAFTSDSQGSRPEGPAPREAADRPTHHDPFELVGSGRTEPRLHPGRHGENRTDNEPDLEPLTGLLEFLPDVADGDGPASEWPRVGASGTSRPPEEEDPADEAFAAGDQWKTMDAYQLDEPPVSSPAGPSQVIGSDSPPSLTGAGGDGLQAAPVNRSGRGAGDLTLLPMIDAARQRQLNALGIHAIEDVARWTRADVRRVVRTIPGVTEEEIMEQWIFAAQSILFDRFRAELGARAPED